MIILIGGEFIEKVRVDGGGRVRKSNWKSVWVFLEDLEC